ncbi:MAG: S24 family peptidase [Clostridia bacterium]|nr:S24 family peptidase [Clostridia bacterium]
MSSFSTLLQRLCTERGITLAECAQKINVRASVLESCCTGYSLPSEELILLLCNFFNVDSSVFDEREKAFSLEESGGPIAFPVVEKIDSVDGFLNSKNMVGIGFLAEAMLCGAKSCFGVKVPDDSMRRDGITSDCLAVIAYQKECRQGDIVLALVKDSIVLRRYLDTGGIVHLAAADESYPPIYEFTPIGTLVEIRRVYIA